MPLEYPLRHDPDIHRILIFRLSLVTARTICLLADSRIQMRTSARHASPPPHPQGRYVCRIPFCRGGFRSRGHLVHTPRSRADYRHPKYTFTRRSNKYTLYTLRHRARASRTGFSARMNAQKPSRGSRCSALYNITRVHLTQLGTYTP